MNAGISIVICTYNGAERLPDTLWHIAKQQFSSPIPWELIVVDNKSEDGSAEVAVTEWRNAGSPSALSVIYQPTLGLTYAGKPSSKTNSPFPPSIPTAGCSFMIWNAVST